MGLIESAIRRGNESRATVESPSVPISSRAILAYLGYGESDAGVEVTTQSALGLSAFFACLRVRSESFAALPWKVYQRSGTSRVEVREHPAAEVLRRPGPATSTLGLREAGQISVDGWGNGYVRILRDSRSQIEELEVLPPTTVPRISAGGALYYVTPRADGTVEAIPAADVLHVAGPSLDGKVGLSIVDYHRHTIGYGIAARRLGSRLLANDARPPAVVEIPTPIKEGEAERIEDRIVARHGGQAFGRPIVLGSGAKYQSVGLPADQLQFIQQQEWSLVEVCRLFLVPPHKVGHLKESADRANVEQENLRFAADVLVPTARRWELEADAKLFSAADRARGLYTRVDLRGLLRGDFQTRMNGYRVAREIGILNADEIRELEEENPIGGRAGTVYLVPMNFQDASQEPPPKPAPATEGGAPGASKAPAPEDQARAKARLLELFQDAGARLARRELDGLPGRVQTADRFRAWLDGHRAAIVRAYRAPVRLLVRDLAGELADFDQVVEQLLEAEAGARGAMLDAAREAGTLMKILAAELDSAERARLAIDRFAAALAAEGAA